MGTRTKMLTLIVASALALGAQAAHETVERPECRVEFNNRCQLAQGQVWTGTFGTSARAPQQTGRPVTVTIAANNYVIVQGGGETTYARWTLTDDFISIVDLAGSPDAAACPHQELAKYTYAFSNDCQFVALTARYDECTRRRTLLRGSDGEPLVLDFAGCADNSASCASLTFNARGSVWRGAYGDDHAHFEATFGINGAFIEQSDAGVFFNRLERDNEGTLALTQVGGQYDDQGCGDAVATVSRSTEDVGGACSSWTLQSSDDECESRAERYSNLPLHYVDACTPPMRMQNEEENGEEEQSAESEEESETRNYRVAKRPLEYDSTGVLVKHQHEHHHDRHHRMKAERHAKYHPSEAETESEQESEQDDDDSYSTSSTSQASVADGY